MLDREKVDDERNQRSPYVKDFKVRAYIFNTFLLTRMNFFLREFPERSLPIKEKLSSKGPRTIFIVKDS